MKITVDLDCTPAEARHFLGLPDLTPLHDKYMKTMLDAFEGNSIDQIETVLKSMSPLGDASMRMFKGIMDLGLASGGLGGTKKDK